MGGWRETGVGGLRGKDSKEVSYFQFVKSQSEIADEPSTLVRNYRNSNGATLGVNMELTGSRNESTGKTGLCEPRGQLELGP